jgi:hypothetical protein
MRTRLVLALACAAALGGCAIVIAPNDGDVRVHSAFSDNTVAGNGMPARDERAVAALPGLDVGGAMLVEVRVGPAPSLLIEADSNLLPYIRTESRGDTLRISSERNLRSGNPIRVTYTVPSLTQVRSSGSGRMVVRGLDGAPLAVRQGGSGLVKLVGNVASLDAKVSGSGHLDATELKSASAELDLTGSGRVTLGQLRGDYARASVQGSGLLQATGAVRSLNVRVHGSGNADMAGLASDQADLVTNGSGGITATVKRSLIARSNGSGGIRVYGNPAQRSVSGNHVHLLD